MLLDLSVFPTNLYLNFDRKINFYFRSPKRKNYNEIWNLNNKKISQCFKKKIIWKFQWIMIFNLFLFSALSCVYKPSRSIMYSFRRDAFGTILEIIQNWMRSIHMSFNVASDRIERSAVAFRWPSNRGGVFRFYSPLSQQIFFIFLNTLFQLNGRKLSTFFYTNTTKGTKHKQ